MNLEDNMSDVESSESPLSAHHLHFPRFRMLLLGALVVVAGLWITPVIAAWVADLDLDELAHPYGVIFGFVVFDAIIPVFPSESLLTTASNLAAQDDSSIELWRLIVAGSLGAVIGDSLLYWLSRTVLRRFISAQVDKAQQNDKVARTMEVMSRTAPTLILFGRFVPGVRFMVNATMGLTRYRYPSFLLWDAIGGTLWATYTCVFSYLVATVIADKPVLSIAVSVVVTTALLGLLYRPLRKSWEQTGQTTIPATGLAT
jgi:membrane protein DedA with SNARE-associated domain